MPAIAHVRRRGARYLFRRRLHLRNLISEPINVALGTADPAVARVRAVRLAARWDRVRMQFDGTHMMGRGFLKASEITALMKRELDTELGLAIAGHEEPKADRAKLERTHRVMVEAYRIGADLEPGTETLPQAERDRLADTGWSDTDIRAVGLMMSALCSPKLFARAASSHLSTMEAPINAATLRDGARQVAYARSEAQARALHYFTFGVQNHADTADLLLQTSASQLRALQQPVASPSPPRAPAQAPTSPFLKPDMRRFSEVIDSTVASIVASGDWNADLDQRVRIMRTFAWITGDKRLCEYDHTDPMAFVEGLRLLPKDFKFGSTTEGHMSVPFAKFKLTLGTPAPDKKRSKRTINRDLTVMSRANGELMKTAWKPAFHNVAVLDFVSVMMKTKAPSARNPDRMPGTPPHLIELFSLPIFTGCGGAKSNRLRDRNCDSVWHDAAY